MSRYSPPTLILVAVLISAALTTGGTAQSTTTTTQAPTASFTDDGNLTLESGPGQQLHGTTSLEAGTEVTVRIQSENASDPFLARPTATVDENGDFTVTQDMNDMSPGSTFTATLRTEQGTLAETTGQVVEYSDNCGSTATKTDTWPDEIAVRQITPVRQGEFVRIPVAVGDRDTVSLTIGDDADGFGLEATLTDGNDDGRVILGLDTGPIGVLDPDMLLASDQDQVQITALQGGDDGVEPGSYDVAVAPTENAAVADVGTVSIEERVAVSTDDPGLATHVVTVQQGRTTSIPVSMGDRERLSLTIGDEDENYRLNATVVDGDGDGRVVVLFDSGAAGREAPTLRPTDESDRAMIDSETTLENIITDTEYSMSLSTIDDGVVSVGTVSVTYSDITVTADESTTTSDAPETTETTQSDTTTVTDTAVTQSDTTTDATESTTAGEGADFGVLSALAAGAVGAGLIGANRD